MAMNKNKSLFSIIAIFFSGWVLFVWWYENSVLNSVEKDLYQYGRYLEVSLWDLNQEQAIQHLHLIGQAGSYQSLAVFDLDDSEFAKIDIAKDDSWLSQVLRSIHFINDQKIVQPIYHNGTLLGRIEAKWINDLIYTHLLVALLFALCTKIVHYYIRLSTNRHELELNNINLIESEKRLRESQSQLQRIADTLDEGLVLTNLEDQILDLNSRMLELTGFSREELLNRTASEMLVPEEQHAQMAERNKERGRGISSTYEIQLCRKDGSQFWAEIHAAPFHNSTGEITGSLGAISDLTERKRLEAHLQQGQKMDIIGQLTAGIAHNFNNMLMGIMGNIEFALEDGPNTIKPFLNESYRICGQAADMVSQLMAYSRRGTHSPHAAVSLEATIERTVAICKTTFDRKINFTTEIGSETPHAFGDAIQLEQSLLNLLINARDALSSSDRDNPTIHVKAARIEINDRTESTSTDAYEGTFICVEVRDNGIGIEAENLDNIFDPFYTTKAVDQGTGLGLSTVHGIVGLHNGWIECQSEFGQGTTFFIYLPVAQENLTANEPTSAQALSTGTEKILVIDDEAPVRRILSRALTDLGYTITLANNGQVGIKLLQESPFDLVLLDLSMPLTSGQEVLKQWPKHSRAKIIVLTGYTASKDQDDLSKVDAVVKKPIKIAELSHKIREIIDS